MKGIWNPNGTVYFREKPRSIANRKLFSSALVIPGFLVLAKIDTCANFKPVMDEKILQEGCEHKMKQE